MNPLAEVGLLFLRLGCTAFGGPLAHLALMEREVVRERQWMDRAAFLDLLGLAQLVPGPTSTEMAMLLGRARAGVAGLVVAGLAFILPSSLMVGGLAWMYVRYGALPAASGWLAGLKAALLAVVLQALLNFARPQLKDLRAWGVALAALLLAALGLPLLAILLLAGMAMLALRAQWRASAAAFLGWPTLAPATGLLGLFLAFLKIGAVLYGSGYVLLAFLRAEFIVARPWITERQLLDAVAVGQFTPGPVFTTATFLGFLMRGGPGALLATLAIFLPAFLYTGLAGPLLSRLQKAPRARAFLDGVNLGSLALMALVIGQLARTAVTGAGTGGLALASGLLLWRTKLNPTWILLGAGLLGWLLPLVGVPR
jgi:chromate transporter